MARIFWSPEEAEAVVDRFIELRIDDLLTQPIRLFNKAQLILPKDRRRTVPGVGTVGGDFSVLLKRKLAALSAAFHAARDQPAAASVEPVEPKAEPAPDAPAFDPQEPVPYIVQVEVPRFVEKPVDREKFLRETSTGLLLGVLLERGLPLLGASQEEKAAPAEPSPPPRLSNGDRLGNGHHSRVVLGESEPKPAQHRVLVVGIFPDSKRFIEEKAAGLANLKLSYVDSNQKSFPPLSCDYVVLMRRIISHSQAEYVRANMNGARIVFVEGGRTELLRKLADLNSLSPVSA